MIFTNAMQCLSFVQGLGAQMLPALYLRLSAFICGHESLLLP
jgi:hypothetical protein